MVASRRSGSAPRAVWLLSAALLVAMAAAQSHGRPVKEVEGEPRLGPERLVFQTDFGNIELGFFPDVAPKTVKHILNVGRLGLYNNDHFFRVDKGFVAQVRRAFSRLGTPARTHTPFQEPTT